jgi:hypothetical protein
MSCETLKGRENVYYVVLCGLKKCKYISLSKGKKINHNFFFHSFKPISSTWYDYWGADYGTYNYNPYIGGLGIPTAKPPASTEKNGSQTVSVSVSQGKCVHECFKACAVFINKSQCLLLWSMAVISVCSGQR